MAMTLHSKGATLPSPTTWPRKVQLVFPNFYWLSDLIAQVISRGSDIVAKLANFKKLYLQGFSYF